MTAVAETGRGRRNRTDRRAQRTGAPSSIEQLAVLDRNLSDVHVLSEEGLAQIEANAEMICQEIGLNISEDAFAIQKWKEHGADVEFLDGKDDTARIRFSKGMLRALCKTAPSSFIQHARNPARNVEIGGKKTVFAPVYGPPFYRSYDEGRRYATLADFETLVKLTYMSPALHHSGGTVCEPVDIPVNKRHFDMVYSHLKLSDKPIMGSVTAPERAQDTVDMCKLVFGADFVDQNCVTTSLINVNSPLTYDGIMNGALRVYAENNQACIVSPFIISGAMAPVSPGGVMAQALAEAMMGIAYGQMLRPGSPVIFGTFAASMSMASGAPTFGTPEPALIIMGMAQLARRMNLPFRSGGSLNASKVPDAQAAYETMMSILPSVGAGVNFMLHAAGWLEGGLVSSPEKLVMDADQLAMVHIMQGGVDMSENGQALDAIREVGPGGHYLGCDHTNRNFKTAFYESKLANSASYEQWEIEGSQDMYQRANTRWKRMISEYDALAPAIDPGVDDALTAFIAERKSSMPDAMY
ncbi:MAG: trimethylamine methyltransferase [Geminicoccus sp.]|nr:trimethylamine methyltransferase [Geminicoccus sp.]